MRCSRALVLVPLTQSAIRRAHDTPSKALSLQTMNKVSHSRNKLLGLAHEQETDCIPAFPRNAHGRVHSDFDGRWRKAGRPKEDAQGT